MTRDEHKAAIQQLIGMVAQEHQASASQILTNLSNDYEQTLTASETASSNVTKLTSDNEALRAANMKLFLQVGSVPKNDPEKPAGNEGNQDEDKPLPFTDLFNEKGELI